MIFSYNFFFLLPSRRTSVVVNCDMVLPFVNIMFNKRLSSTKGGEINKNDYKKRDRERPLNSEIWSQNNNNNKKGNSINDQLHKFNLKSTKTQELNT